MGRSEVKRGEGGEQVEERVVVSVLSSGGGAKEVRAAAAASREHYLAHPAELVVVVADIKDEVFKQLFVPANRRVRERRQRQAVRVPCVDRRWRGEQPADEREVAVCHLPLVSLLACCYEKAVCAHPGRPAGADSQDAVRSY